MVKSRFYEHLFEVLITDNSRRKGLRVDEAKKLIDFLEKSHIS